ncbi:branched-chain amino acid ABC transporter permease [Herbaspirillum sp. RTI4]|uniref:branched-chain amino acid ABC transporter permease n=1 Tax=Herbaspirillum sp. RTI4 TaxID=3048640 RepID=UPI002AB3CC3B|nr:branched-chain amino acid ABC transporter permease [Herbaspirillum sp. RTI4]MDY7578129.1 branched-chain amino acid ABC transporter permease [Herbaspirillum sp. RTI4]MEA9980718.1 branched-chain amino acid ABC transporter permease [Herbaspirillum sp. RTI4]
MDLTIVAALVQDGMTTGAIYALLSLALVLIFSVTRVIFLPQGEFAAYGALTLVAIQSGQTPLTVWLLLALGAATFVAEISAALKYPERRLRLPQRLPLLCGKFLLFPIALALLAQFLPLAALPMPLQIALALAIVVPMGPMIYRVAYQPLAHASVLVLLIVSLGVHLAMVGLGLLMFGPEGSNTKPFTDAQLTIGDLVISGQSIAVVATVIALVIAIYFYFERSLSGKALRATAVNRLGARLVGIGTNQAGKLALTLGAGIGAVCGMLIAPFTIISYESGFLIALKGFVGAIFGGLASYPLAVAGSVGVGLLESFSSFWASSFKDLIVFTVIIPVLVWRSLSSTHMDEEA